jgi:hypothetical protein
MKAVYCSESVPENFTLAICPFLHHMIGNYNLYPRTDIRVIGESHQFSNNRVTVPYNLLNLYYFWNISFQYYICQTECV